MRYLRLAAFGDWLVKQQDNQPYDLPLQFTALLQQATLASFQDSLNQAITAQQTQMMLPLCYRRLVQELSSIGVLMRLEKLTGLQRLLPDPQLIAAGCVEAAEAGGEFPVQHPETGLSRALTLTIDLHDSQDKAAGNGQLLSRVANVLEAKTSAVFVMHYYFSPKSPV